MSLHGRRLTINKVAITERGFEVRISWDVDCEECAFYPVLDRMEDAIKVALAHDCVADGTDLHTMRYSR